jgi:hypothetical protein
VFPARPSAATRPPAAQPARRCDRRSQHWPPSGARPRASGRWRASPTPQSLSVARSTRSPAGSRRDPSVARRSPGAARPGLDRNCRGTSRCSSRAHGRAHGRRRRRHRRRTACLGSDDADIVRASQLQHAVGDRDLPYVNSVWTVMAQQHQHIGPRGRRSLAELQGRRTCALLSLARALALKV